MDLDKPKLASPSKLSNPGLSEFHLNMQAAFNSFPVQYARRESRKLVTAKKDPQQCTFSLNSE